MINRISLDTAEVRASAVSALGIMGLNESELASHIANILSLLQHENEEEEVRQRSVYFTQVLASKEPVSASSPKSQSDIKKTEGNFF